MQKIIISGVKTAKIPAKKSINVQMKDVIHNLTKHITGLEGPVLLETIAHLFQTFREPILLARNSFFNSPTFCHVGDQLQQTDIPLSFLSESVIFVQDYKELSSHKSSLVAIRAPPCLSFPSDHSVMFKCGGLSINKLPQCITEEFQNIESQGFRVEYFDDARSEQFLRTYFHPDVVESFRILKPGAFKCDLFRFCLLYYFGGVYSDLKIKLLVPLLDFLSPITLVEDWVEDDLTVLQISFMAFPRRHKLCELQIRQIVNNVRHQFYGKHVLDATGPRCFGMVVRRETQKVLKLHLKFSNSKVRMGKVDVLMTKRLRIPGMLSGCYALEWTQRNIYASTVHKWSLEDDKSLLL